MFPSLIHFINLHIFICSLWRYYAQSIFYCRQVNIFHVYLHFCLYYFVNWFFPYFFRIQKDRLAVFWQPKKSHWNN
jgi:hypothetical protein